MLVRMGGKSLLFEYVYAVTTRRRGGSESTRGAPVDLVSLSNVTTCARHVFLNVFRCCLLFIHKSYANDP